MLLPWPWYVTIDPVDDGVNRSRVGVVLDGVEVVVVDSVVDDFGSTVPGNGGAV